ncbi:MAG: serine/threonine-protein kinase PknK [Deltaproteobacteria bacterium]|nr:serine/threonine-protein kinase PknK [Deltaproteobacteria bacterium]
MINIPGYQVLTVIKKGANSIVYRGRKAADDLPVVLKIMRKHYPSLRHIDRYKREFEIVKSLDQVGVVKAYDLIRHRNRLLLVLEDFGGSSLDILMAEKKLVPKDFFSIALQVCDTLATIHEADIIHKDINPTNIVFNPATGQAKIIDFGIASISAEHPATKNPKVLEGNLAYMSPEQTGKMNHDIDYRTDFYSLGATFYELLTGRLPFDATDAMELVHCHLARRPEPPHLVKPVVPKIISNIVMKLLAKNAEARYQSALGIKADLVEYIDRLRAFGVADDFQLGNYDVPLQFLISQKIYGREREISSLLEHFDQVRAGGIAITLVSGYAGIGKTSLIMAIHKPVTQRRGYFISGKFDQFQRSIPLSAVTAALRDLIKQLLAEGDDRLHVWQESILNALGPNAGVMIQLIPELELITGPQPPAIESGHVETSNRFNYIFLNSFRVFCRPEHPLVFFLDDLQWADSASLKLLEEIIFDPEINHFYLIGAYRDHEVHPGHPLMTTLDKLNQENAPVSQIRLAPLPPEHISELISDSLCLDPDSVRPLTELVGRKTAGNPFFISQFLRALVEDKLIVFDHHALQWQWNLADIENTSITDNVVDLLLIRFKNLQSTTKHVLSLAACLGNTFDLPTLAALNDQSVDATRRTLEPAIQAGFIQSLAKKTTGEAGEEDSSLVSLANGFVHDRVRQAAYGLIDEDKRTTIHLRIGRLLLMDLDKDKQEKRLFELVDHLNTSRNLITDKQELVILAQLNLRAGKKARDAAAFSAASEYLTLGLACLPVDAWESHYDLTYQLHLESADTEYINARFDRTEELVHSAINRVKSAREQAALSNSLARQNTMRGRYLDVIRIGTQALAKMGIDLPQTDLPAILASELGRLKGKMSRAPISSLADLPEMTDENMKTAVRTLADMLTAAYQVNKSLYGWLVIRIIDIFLSHGVFPKFSFIFANYGMIVVAAAHEYQAGYELGLLARDMVAGNRDQAARCVASHLLANVLSHWVRHLKESDSLNEESIQAGRATYQTMHVGNAYSYRLLNYFFVAQTWRISRQKFPTQSSS